MIWNRRIGAVLITLALLSAIGAPAAMAKGSDKGAAAQAAAHEEKSARDEAKAAKTTNTSCDETQQDETTTTDGEATDSTAANASATDATATDATATDATATDATATDATTTDATTTDATTTDATTTDATTTDATATDATATDATATDATATDATATDATATDATATETAPASNPCSKADVNLTDRGQATQHNPNVDANGQLVPGTAASEQEAAKTPEEKQAEVQAHITQVKEASRVKAKAERQNGQKGAYLVYVNGDRLNITPIAKNSRTLVPFRFLAEALGATVDWEQSTKTVTMTIGDKTVVLQIGATTALVNGEEVSLEVPAEINESRTFVPLRFIAEALGADVDWDAATGAITVITTPAEDSTTAPADDSTTTAPADDSTTTAPADDSTTTAPADDSTTTAPSTTGN